jgi:hypothetical protein
MTYTIIEDVNVIQSVGGAFGFGSNEKYNGTRVVEIRQGGGELSVTARGRDAVKELVLNDGGRNLKDAAKITFKETFTLNGLQRTTAIYPDGHVEPTNLIYYHSQNFTGIARPIPMYSVEVEAERKRVTDIAAVVRPLVLPFISPTAPITKPGKKTRAAITNG